MTPSKPIPEKRESQEASPDKFQSSNSFQVHKSKIHLRELYKQQRLQNIKDRQRRYQSVSPNLQRPVVSLDQEKIDRGLRRYMQQQS